jgi:hypothetical protein
MWSANKLSNNETALNVMYQLEKDRERETDRHRERNYDTQSKRERR